MKRRSLLALISAIVLALSSCHGHYEKELSLPPELSLDSTVAYVDYSGGIPSFDFPYTTVAFEYYSPLDGLGRCGTVYACLGPELMPNEEEKREPLSEVTPTGWHQASYPELIEEEYLYNRCHLIGYQLAGEGANPRNLITGTRFMNIEGMLPFENQVAAYIKETGNHVLYRVTPVYKDLLDLLAYGVIMEALSVEDGGVGICFSVFVYNRQPGVAIDYGSGRSYLLTTPTEGPPTHLVVNTSTKKIHRPECSFIDRMKEENKAEHPYQREVLDELINGGYTVCETCKPPI